MEHLIGFAIGTLCGVVPLIFGLYTKHKILGVVGISVTALSGVLFVLFEKSPFTAIGVAAVFSIFNFASHKKKNQPEEEDEHSDDEF